MDTVATTVLQLPRSVFGLGALSCLRSELDALGVRRALLVSDRGLAAAGLLARVQALLPTDAPCFADVTSNPVFDDAMAALRLYRDAGCDGVVALGGGSVIDTAKYVALLATHGGSPGDYVNRPDPLERPAAPLLVIPTTAGTGSEASPDAGIHPQPDARSVGISSRWAVAHVVLLDPVLTIDLPPKLTAATGIDALTHCVEGYLSRTDSMLGDALALDGIRRVMGHVERATTHGADLVARSEMLTAAYAGGASIGMGLGPAHAVAGSCSDQGLHHGMLSGIGCVATLDAVLARVPHKRAALADALGLHIQASASAALTALLHRLGLPATLAEAGYHAPDPAELARAAHASPFNKASRWHPSAREYQDLIEASLSGRIPGATPA